MYQSANVKKCNNDIGKLLNSYIVTLHYGKF